MKALFFILLGYFIGRLITRRER
jgi:hypothetical protein